LAGLLWLDWSEQAARNNLRHALAVLRAALRDGEANPPFLHITRQTIQFNAASDAWIDVAAFTSVLHRAGSADLETMAQLEEAVELYGGDLLEGFSLPDSAAFEEWALLLREQLRRQVMDALNHLVILHEKCGQYARALPYAWRQTELDPWREEAHVQVMRLLAFSGRRSEAMAQYETCRQLLAEGLGVEPEEQTTAVFEQIRAGEIAPSHRPSSRPPHNLPTSLVPFVRRETELANIRYHLRDPNCRLLTLAGPGGSGKTRLAVEAAMTMLSETPQDLFADGLYFVSLAPLQTTDTIVPAIAQALGFPFSTAAESGPEVEPEQQLLEHLSRKRMLLILDNFEHLLSGAQIATDILRAAPDVKILVTSRAKLNARGEFLYAVPGMDYPQYVPESVQDLEHFASIQLFLQAARRSRPGFKPADDDLREVARICHLVEGMPLAVLLAAAWIEVLSPGEIASELSGEIEGSLDFLETDWRDVPERQRSLRAVFDHSWRLLTARQRAAMQALSVFRGGFTRHAAEQVAKSSLQDLRALVDRSFMQRTPRGRYEVHELLRQYSTSTLGASPSASQEAHDRHCTFFAVALEQWDKDLRGPRQVAALREMEVDSENIRAAWDWAVGQGNVDRMDQAMEGYAWFQWWRGHYKQGEAGLQAAAESLAVHADLAPPGEGPRVLARALAWQSYFSRALGRGELALQLQRRGLALLERPDMADLDTRAERALLMRNMGFTVMISEYEQARHLLEQSLSLYRELCDEWQTAETLSFLGSVARLQGAYGEAHRLNNECLAICRALGDQAGIAWSLATLAPIATRQGRFEEAERLARESIAASQELGYREITALAQLSLGEALESLARFAEAHSVLEESLEIFDDLGRRGWLTSAQTALSSVNLHLGQYEKARDHAETGLALAQERGLRFRIGQALLLLGCVALAEQQYAEASRYLEESVAVYRGTGQPDDIACATAISAYAACGSGQLARAHETLSAALQMATELQYAYPIMYGLPAVGLLLAHQGEAERAVELYETASHYPLVVSSRWFADIAGATIDAAAANLPVEVVAEAKARGQARDLHATLSELLAQL
jgi:predicted ATPase/DNA-binding SARP family transcriptional activator